MPKTLKIILKGCQNGSKKSQMQLYSMYCNSMFNIACRYLNEEDAKDAMQDAFIKAFTNINNFNNKFTFGSWLKRIVINQCLDNLKRKKVDLIPLENDDIYYIEQNDDWLIDDKITKAEIENAIQSLTIKYKLVINLYLFEGYDHEEISQILKIPISTSRTYLYRGKNQLKKLLKNECYAK